MEETPQQPAAMPNILDYSQPVAQNAPAAPPMLAAPYMPAVSPYAPAASPYARGMFSGDMFSGNKLRLALRAVAVAVVVVLLIVILYKVLSPFVRDRRIEDHGWVVYYRKGCGACTKQKQILGPYKNSVECGADGKVITSYIKTPPLPCNSPLIKGFPFWYNTKTKASRVGVQDAAALKRMMHH